MIYKPQLGDIEFYNPILIASSPFTENYENIEKGILAGAGGIVLKSTGVFERKCEEKNCEECEKEKRIVNLNRLLVSGREIISSSTNSEHCERLTIEEANALVEKIKGKFPDFPVITSFSPERLEDFDFVSKLMGDVVEFNTRYFMRRKGPVELVRYRGSLSPITKYNCPQILGENTERMKEFNSGVERVKKPKILKIDFSQMSLEAQLEMSVDGFTVLDSEKRISLTMEGNHNIMRQGGIGSVSGDSLKWSSYNLSRSIRREYPDKYISACGGIFAPRDVRRLLKAGVNTVQVCSAIYFYGFERVRKLVDSL